MINYCLAVTLNQPESILYDEQNDLYIISNIGSQGGPDGKILTMDKNGNLDIVIESGLNDPKGMVLIEGKIYATDVNSIAIIDYGAKSLLKKIEIGSSMFLNDICYDGDNFLYITETQLNQIYKFNLKTEEVTALNAHGQIDKPNGIIYEKEQNRLAFVSFREKSPIQAIDLETLNVSVLKQTEFDYLDGIAKDREGNYYISSWGNTNPNQGKIYKYKSDFSGDMVVLSDLSGPADIFFNPFTDTLAVPNMTTNSISYTWLPTKPSAPKLIYPENDAKDLGQVIAFSWARGLGAARYYIRLSLNPEFDPYLREDTIWYKTSGTLKGFEKNTKYYYKIRCCNLIQKSDWTEIRSFTTAGLIVEPPVLIFPEDNSTNVSLNPVFKWSSTGADKYNIQLSLDENFTEPVKILINDITDTIFEMPGKLAANTKYYWRANSVRQTTISSWSNYRTFTTTSGIAVKPDLLFPGNNTVNIPLKPNFKWEQIDKFNTAAYHLLISKYQSFEPLSYSVWVNTDKSDTTLESELEPDTKYYWRVAALSIQDSIPYYSEIWSFNTLNPSAVNEIILDNPIINIFPNPATDYIRINIITNESSKVYISIYDELGNFKGILYDGCFINQNNYFSFKTAGYSSGIYVLKIIIDKKLLFYNLNIIN